MKNNNAYKNQINVMRLFFAFLFLYLSSLDILAIERQALETRRLILNHNQPLSEQIVFPGVIYVVSSDFDLEKGELRLPSNSILEFNGGRLLNGVVSGNKMPTNDSYCPEQFGAGMSGDDTEAIQSCLNVCHNIEMKGYYHVSNNYCDKKNSILLVPSNTNICLDGTITLLPVNSSQYSIFSIKNSHTVNIYGNGSIIGDKDKTNIIKGEHGMGISITGSSSCISLNGLSILNCFGDAIYIGAEIQNDNYLEPSFIEIMNCELYQCRRQGVSIVIGHHIKINNCNIHDIRGTAPGSAIDIEPQYKNHIIHDVTISKSQFNNCVMALYCGGANIKSYKINISDCSSNSGAIEWRLCDKTTITNCTFCSPMYVDNVVIQDSFVQSLYYKGDNDVISSKPNIYAKNCKFQIIGCVIPNGYVRLKDCIVDYPADLKILDGSPLRGGFLELIDCSCTGLGANYKYSPEIRHLKAIRCFFQYNKAVCLQGDVLDLKYCVVKGQNIEEDNALVYARKSGSRMRGCELYYLNSTSSKLVWVIRGGDAGGFEVLNTVVYSHNLDVISTRNITPISILFNKINQIIDN